MKGQHASRPLQRALVALLLTCSVCAALPALAAGDKGAAWNTLTPAQQQLLAPLQRDWPTLEPNRRQKWLEMASRFPSMSPDERRRVQERMAEWVRLTPAERTEARLRFQEVRQLPAEERHAKWQAYQALPEEQRKTLAQRAAPPAKAASAVDPSVKARTLAADSSTARRAPAPAASAAASRAVAPIVVQVRPGATTTTMSARNVPRAKPAQGAPKIAATASYVDPATLLPKRAPQQGSTMPVSTTDNAELP